MENPSGLTNNSLASIQNGYSRNALKFVFTCYAICADNEINDVFHFINCISSQQ